MDEIVKYNMQLFARFLKNKNAYCQYRHNLSIQPLFENFFDTIQGGVRHPICYLSQAFNWDCSPQRDEFWRNLHTEWGRSYCGLDYDGCYRMSIATNFEQRKLIKE